MRLHKTGHPIADTVSDLIGELPNGEYNAAYGILRHDLFHDGQWFEVDKGFWGSDHYSGNYRVSFNGTQPIYRECNHLSEPHGQTLEPWRKQDGYTLVCPPTSHVCDFFKIDYASWLMRAVKGQGVCIIRHKGEAPIEWDNIAKVITFNSTVGVEALRRGIEVISDPDHSTIGSFTKSINKTIDYDRDILFNFMQAHSFKLDEKEKIKCLIQHYLSKSA